nr:stage II sporulation protein D [Maliibacterium massiliense]
MHTEAYARLRAQDEAAPARESAQGSAYTRGGDTHTDETSMHQVTFVLQDDTLALDDGGASEARDASFAPRAAPEFAAARAAYAPAGFAYASPRRARGRFAPPRHVRRAHVPGILKLAFALALVFCLSCVLRLVNISSQARAEAPSIPIAPAADTTADIASVWAPQQGAQAEPPAQSQAPAPSGQQANAPAPVDIATSVAVYVKSQNKLIQMDLEDYLCGVVSAEMPASYEPEALKAQAVAARTYTVRKIAALGGGPCGAVLGAEICSNPAHCQAYLTDDELRSRWGASYDANHARIVQAVKDTRGLILTYEGKPITALYHANSGGATEDSEKAFSQALPYLRSVSSPGEDAYPSYQSQKVLARAEAAAIIKQNKPEANVTAENIQETFTITARTASGRVDTASVGGVSVRGTALRDWFSLRSTNFEMAFDDQNLTFNVKGYGHGVGMSQNGANAMAQGGSSYAAILTHYYTGATLQAYQ